MSLVPIILQVRTERTFPTRPRAQIRFSAESLSVRGVVSPCRSSDICGEVRMTEKEQHTIVRTDFYIDCTCGYEGPANHGACPACGTTRATVSISSISFSGE